MHIINYNCLMQLWGLASLKFVEQASRLETQAGFLGYSLEEEFLFWETLVFALKDLIAK